MKFFLALVLVLHGAVAQHPIVKVIGLLKGLDAKVQAEGGDELVLYKKFVKWCKASEDTLNTAIKKDKADIEVHTSTVEAKTKENETLSIQIDMLENQIGYWTVDGSAADKKRSTEAGLYTTADGDYTKTITAIGAAITAIVASKPAALVQKQMQDLASLPLVLEQLTAAQTAALIGGSLTGIANTTNTSTVTITPEFKKTENGIKEAKEGRPDDMIVAAPEKVSKYHGGGVVDVLKKLELTFKDEQVAATDAETAAINAHTVSKEAATAAITAAGVTKGTKTTNLGTCLTDLTKAKGDLKDSKDDLEDDDASMTTTKKACGLKKSEWEERSTLRANEEAAIRAGIEILEKVAGVETAPPTNPVPPPSPVQLLQSAQSSLDVLQGADPRAKVVNLLRAEAKRSQSKTFEVFANKLAAHADDPFDQVNVMIDKMIWRLNAEQKDEDDHKNWCDVELSKTNISKLNREDKNKTLGLKIVDAKASVGLLVIDIKAADDEVDIIQKHMTDATDIRNEGKKENEEAIEDAKQAQAAIAQAIAVLLDFYKNSGEVPKESWEFLQKTRAPVVLPKDPATWSSSYTGVADPNNQPSGVCDVLKVIASDFAQMESDTKAQEAMDKKAFDDEIKKCAIEKARQRKDSEVKTQEKKRQEEHQASMEKTQKHTQDELASVDQYLKDLAPACIDGDSTYDDRKGKRDDEITALHEAQTILKDAGSNSTAPAAAAPTMFLAPIKRVQ